MSTSGFASLLSYVANNDIPGGARVKYIGNNLVDLAGAADAEIGAAIIDTGKILYAKGTAVGILTKHPLQYAIAGGAITDGALVARYASGQVVDSGAAGAGALYAVATSAGSVAGDLITVIPVQGAANVGA